MVNVGLCFERREEGADEETGKTDTAQSLSLQSQNVLPRGVQGQVGDIRQRQLRQEIAAADQVNGLCGERLNPSTNSGSGRKG